MTTTSVLIRKQLPETIVIPGQRLGRHVTHDERSRAYTVRPARAASVKWQRNIPILDQGDLGSCVGNAATGALGTKPCYDTLVPGFDLSEQFAVKVYSAATKADSYPGSYPPTDTGTDGLSAAKVLTTDHLVKGYVHAFSWDEFVAGMQAGPAMVGIAWLTGCDDPDSRGVVHYSGEVRGGHEILARELDLENQVVGLDNSWSSGWGLKGSFYMSIPDFQKALADDGDATFLVPNTSPAPEPQPVTRRLYSFDEQADADLTSWASKRHYRDAAKAAAGWNRRTTITGGTE